MGVSTWQIIVILLVVLLLFGGKKIPELAQGLGKGIKNFKDAVKEGEEETTVNTTEKVENKTTQNNTTAQNNNQTQNNA
ncbi:MAG: twin-arginine translocase TatA/TatE family subunit [Epsilonproteobacteria bacterium]|nr:twin-arginine translocase TatA/TatE family subunit [Campylobacterota bacterium]